LLGADPFPLGWCVVPLEGQGVQKRFAQLPRRVTQELEIALKSDHEKDEGIRRRRWNGTPRPWSFRK